MATKGTAADRVAAALAMTASGNGRPGVMDGLLAKLPPDEADAWRAVLADHSIPAQHVWRAMRHAGIDIGATESAVKTWRRNNPTG